MEEKTDIHAVELVPTDGAPGTLGQDTTTVGTGDGALRLVENHHVVVWRRRIADAFIAKMVHVLDERLDLLAYRTFARAWPTG